MSKAKATMPEFIPVCPVTDIPDGQREVFSIYDRWVAIFNVGGRYYAIEDVCSHDGNMLTEDADGKLVPLKGYEIECPRHGSRFDIRSGKVQNPPALLDIAWFETRVVEGMLEIAI